MTDREILTALLDDSLYDLPLASDLADHLIANGVTVQKWVPVTERLPEDWQYVLTLRGTTPEVLWFVSNIRSVDRYLSRCERPAFILYDSEYGYVEVVNVTHWTPLPEPPKEGDT